jgi:ATP-binding cassette subfamily F protein uup
LRGSEGQLRQSAQPRLWLEGLPALIESLEKEQADIRKALLDSELFTRDPAKATALFARDAQIDTELLSALERWEILS